jgi:hypothetical protein
MPLLRLSNATGPGAEPSALPAWSFRMSASPVCVHSVAEAYLYLLTLRCESCGRGPLRARADLTRTDEVAGGWRMEIRCGGCARETALAFAIDPPPTREEAGSGRINPTPRPSQAIDLLGWLALFQRILSASEKEADRQAGRQLAWEAAQCLDEALKFYEPGNDLPPEAAFFSADSRRRFLDHPGQFSRERWRERRLRLPDLGAGPRPEGRPRPRWWRFWRGPGP